MTCSLLRYFYDISFAKMICHYFTGITAVEKINEAVDAGDAEQTIIMLKLPAAQLDMVADAHATQYQVILTQAKSGKAEVSYCGYHKTKKLTMYYINP